MSITQCPGQAYLEDCLVSHFACRSTILVWGVIYGNQKEPLVIWDTPTWGTINSQTYINRILQPHLHPWWQFLHQVGSTNSGYIYLQHDNASAHRSRATTSAMQELGIATYVLP